MNTDVKTKQSCDVFQNTRNAKEENNKQGKL